MAMTGWSWSRSWASKPLGQPWHSLLLALFALALFSASAYSYTLTRDFLRSARHATGVVVRNIGSSDGIYPRVRFVDEAGQSHEFDSTLKSRPARFHEGERVQVAYLPHSPQTASIEDFLELWFMSLITGVIGLCLASAAILLWVFRARLFGPPKP